MKNLKFKKISRGHYKYKDYELINMPNPNYIDWHVYKGTKLIKKGCSYIGGRWLINKLEKQST